MRRSSRNDFTPESLHWFERIEALRDRLAASTESITYGPALPTSTRSAEQLRRGTSTRAEVGTLTRTASLPAAWGRFLHAAVACTGARRGIELGTCVGISAAYQASALDHLEHSRFVTCEGAPALAEIAAHNLSELGFRHCRVVQGRFDDTVPAVAADLAPIDFAFIDGHHDEHATVRYFEMLQQHLAPTAVLVFDDIRWSPGMGRAWRAIRAAPTVVAAADLRRLGVVVVSGGTGRPEAAASRRP